MSVEYSEPLAAWKLSRQGTHGSYAVHRVGVCARTRFVYFKNNIVAIGKISVTTTKQQRIAQAGCTTTSTEQRAHCTEHCTVARNLAACNIFQRLPSDAVYSQRCGSKA